MTQDKELLLKDICGRLPYGVKVLYHGWDSAHGCEFSTVEDLIGIDDRFIHTLWRGERDKHSIVEPLSIIDYKPYLRPMSSMTEEEARDIAILHGYNPFEILSTKVTDEYMDIILDNCDSCTITTTIWYDGIISSLECFDYFNKKMLDFRGLIPKDLALSTDEFNPYKD